MLARFEREKTDSRNTRGQNRKKETRRAPPSMRVSPASSVVTTEEDPPEAETRSCTPSSVANRMSPRTSAPAAGASASVMGNHRRAEPFGLFIFEDQPFHQVKNPDIASSCRERTSLRLIDDLRRALLAA
jgi:hypothetical protein